MFEKRSLKNAATVAHNELQAAGFNLADYTDVGAMVDAFNAFQISRNTPTASGSPRFRWLPEAEPTNEQSASAMATDPDSSLAECGSDSKHGEPVDIPAAGDSTEFDNTDKAENESTSVEAGEDASKEPPDMTETFTLRWEPVNVAIIEKALMLAAMRSASLDNYDCFEILMSEICYIKEPFQNASKCTKPLFKARLGPGWHLLSPQGRRNYRSSSVR